jgi:uncharacterized membrane protein YccC
MDEYERNQQALHDERMRARKQFKDALDEIGRLRKELDKAHRLISQSIGWQREAEIAKERMRRALEEIYQHNPHSPEAAIARLVLGVPSGACDGEEAS